MLHGKLHDDSRLFIKDKGHKKYEPSHNDDRVNVHVHALLAMWHVNVDFQPLLSQHVVITCTLEVCCKGRKQISRNMDLG